MRYKHFSFIWALSIFCFAQSEAKAQCCYVKNLTYGELIDVRTNKGKEHFAIKYGKSVDNLTKEDYPVLVRYSTFGDACIRFDWKEAIKIESPGCDTISGNIHRAVRSGSPTCYPLEYVNWCMWSKG